MHDDMLNGAWAGPIAVYGGYMPTQGAGYGASMPAPMTASTPITPAATNSTTASGPARNVVLISWAIGLVLLVLSHTFTFELQE